MMQYSWQLVADQESMPSKVYSIAMIQRFSTKRFDLSNGRTIIGRDEACCDIALPGQHVSRKHAELNVQDGVVTIRDLNSANGTYVNGQQISEAVIKPGDRICFDTITLTLFAPDEDPEATVIHNRLSPNLADGTLFREQVVPQQTDDHEWKVKSEVKPKRPFWTSGEDRLQQGQLPLSHYGLVAVVLTAMVVGLAVATWVNVS